MTARTPSAGSTGISIASVVTTVMLFLMLVGWQPAGAQEASTEPPLETGTAEPAETLEETTEQVETTASDSEVETVEPTVATEVTNPPVATEPPASTEPASTEPPAIGTEATSTEDAGTEPGFAAFAALDAEPMSFENVQVFPPENCLDPQSVGIAFDVVNPDPAFQGISIELFGVTTVGETTVLLDSVLIEPGDIAGAFIASLDGDFSDTFFRWSVSFRLLDGTGVTQQLHVVQIDLDCAPDPVKEGGAMQFLDVSVDPPVDCVPDGEVDISLDIVNSDPDFQGVEVNLFGVTLVGENSILQGSRLITPDEGDGTFSFTLVGDFSDEFQRWSVSFRLLDGGGLTQQLDVKQIELPCAPVPSKETETPESEPAVEAIGNVVPTTVFDCDSEASLEVEVILIAPIGTDESITLILIGIPAVDPIQTVITFAEITGPRDIGSHFVTLQNADFSPAFVSWELDVNFGDQELTFPIVPDCASDPGETETPDETEVPASETATADPVDLVFSNLQFEPVTECVNGFSFDGTIDVETQVDASQGIRIEFFGLNTSNPTPVLIDSNGLNGPISPGTVPFNLTANFSEAFASWFVRASAEPEGLVIQEPVETICDIDPVGTDVPEETSTPEETTVPEETSTPDDEQEELEVRFTIDAPVCDGSGVLDGEVRFFNATESIAGFRVTLVGVDAAGNRVVLDTVNLDSAVGDGTVPFTVSGALAPPFVGFEVTVEVILLRGLGIVVGFDSITLACEIAEESATDEPTQETTVEPTDEPTQETTVEPTDETTAEATNAAVNEQVDEPTAQVQFRVAVDTETLNVTSLPVTGSGAETGHGSATQVFVLLVGAAMCALAAAFSIRRRGEMPVR